MPIGPFPHSFDYRYVSGGAASAFVSGGAAMGSSSIALLGTVGTWENRTPAGLTMVPTAFGGDNFGVQDILVDPVRPQDAYAFVCHQGVWKSTDYGYTWTKVNTGTGGSSIDNGKPWGSAIDTNPSRNPNTPPALYTCCGNDVAGFWRSTDGGVSWVQKTLPDQAALDAYHDQDIYSINANPYNGQHLIIGFHEVPGLVETTDGGDSFTVRSSPDSGISQYYYFIDTGSSVTTATTWLCVPQESGNTYKTTNSSTSWTQVGTNNHPHGCNQIFQAGSGVIYLPGNYGTDIDTTGHPITDGIYRSTDYGSTWHLVSASNCNNVCGTATTLYGSYSWADNTGAVAEPQKAARSPGTSWSSITTPGIMTNGAKGSAVTYHAGTGKYVLIWGCWNAGILRYIEP